MRRLELFTSQINTYYRELLECNVSTSIHQRHLQFLLTEIYKSTVTNNLRFMWHFFWKGKVPYNLRKVAVLYLPPASSTNHQTNSANFRRTLICNQLPISIKPSKSIIEFKTNLKRFGNIDCGCVICRK